VPDEGERPVPKVVFASTVVTGDAGGALLTEDAPLPVATAYGRSKQECERIVVVGVLGTRGHERRAQPCQERLLGDAGGSIGRARRDERRERQHQRADRRCNAGDR
jgi:hypothetical protein